MSPRRFGQLMVLAGAATVATLGAQRTSWGLEARRAHGIAMDNDATDPRLVLFGGEITQAALLGDTWTRGTGGWNRQQVNAIAPTARSGHSVAAIRAGTTGVILFGGRDASRRKRDTWRYQGGVWVELPSGIAPQARESHALAYDPNRNVVVLFGGFDGFLLRNDTWELNPQTGVWQQRAPATVPRPRQQHAMAYEPLTQRILMFGGDVLGSPSADTWAWDGNDWAKLNPTTSPAARFQHAMALDDSLPTGEIVLFGGRTAAQQLDGQTWTFDATNVTWRRETPALSPTARALHAMDYDDGAAQQVVLFAGEDQRGLQVDTWQWDSMARTWQPANPPPPARVFGAMAYDAARDRTVLFGGLDGNNTPLDDTWTFDGTTWTKQNPSSAPPKRYQHDMVWDGARQTVMLFGGRDTSGRVDDVWQWDGTNWQRSPKTGAWPQAREQHRMAFHAASNEVVLFSGNIGSFLLRDTWTWDGSRWTLRAATSPPDERQGHGLAYDAALARTILFGGHKTSPGTALDDTWTWDGTTWTLSATPLRPQRRFDFAMAYDDARARTVLFGGKRGIGGLLEVTTDETWEYDGTTWVQATPQPPPAARAGASMAWHASQRNAVMFGGAAESARLVVNETLLYAPAVEAQDPTFGQGCAGTGGIPGLDRADLAGNWPWLGHTFLIDVQSVPPGSTTFVLLGFSTVACGGLPLPFDLGLVGAPGCALLTCNTEVFPLAPGTTRLPLPIPNQLSLLRQSFFNQALGTDVVNPLGLITSNGGDAVIGAK